MDITHTNGLFAYDYMDIAEIMTYICFLTYAVDVLTMVML